MAQEEQEQNIITEEQNFSEMIRVRYEKLDKLRSEGKDPYHITHVDIDTYAADINAHFEDWEEKFVSLAGRIMAKRGQGKVAFYDMLDSTGRIQLFIRKDTLGEEAYEEIKSYDIGDIIGVKGEVFKTKMGQISIRVQETKLVSKSLKILPEKFHGLKDPDLRYRQRYVDLIVNPEVKDVFLTRSKLIQSIRTFMDRRGFVEVETPVLATLAGGANARPFVTHHNTLDIAMYMRIALELPLKRLIVGGFDKVYEIGRVFRNEGMDATHNPEFTMLESYEAYVDYQAVMQMIEELFAHVSKELLGTQSVVYQDKTIELQAPFARVRMVDLVRQYTGINFDEMTEMAQAVQAAKQLNIEIKEGWGIGKIIEEAFDAYVEANLVQPTFVTHHPVEISPLAKKDAQDQRYTERFELFIGGKEYANGFSELNDPVDQKERFLAQMAKKEQGDDETHPFDKDFVDALEIGLPPTGGVGIGIDRMVMLFTDQHSIRDVILFPTMKPLDSDKKVEKAVETPVEAAPVVEEKIDFSNVVIEPLFEDFVDFETFSKSDFRAVKVLECEAVPKSKKLLKFTLDDGTGVNRTILSGIHAFYEPEELVGKTLIAITNLPPRPMMGIDSCGMLLSAINKRGEEEELHLLMVDNHIPAGAKLY